LPLTTIYGRSQLLARSIRRSPTLTAGERERLLAGTLAIEAAVLALVALIDAIGGVGVDAGDGTAAG
jgi:hypothetical protein